MVCAGVVGGCWNFGWDVWDVLMNYSGCIMFGDFTVVVLGVLG